MRLSASWQQRQIAGCLVLFLVTPFAGAAITPPAAGQQAATAPATNTQSSNGVTSNATDTHVAARGRFQQFRRGKLERRQSGTILGRVAFGSAATTKWLFKSSGHGRRSV